MLELQALSAPALWGGGWLLLELLGRTQHAGAHANTESATLTDVANADAWHDDSCALQLPAYLFYNETRLVVPDWHAGPDAAAVRAVGKALSQARLLMEGELAGLWCDALAALVSSEWGLAHAALTRPPPQSTAVALQAWASVCFLNTPNKVPEQTCWLAVRSKPGTMFLAISPTFLCRWLQEHKSVYPNPAFWGYGLVHYCIMLLQSRTGFKIMALKPATHCRSWLLGTYFNAHFKVVAIGKCTLLANKTACCAGDRALSACLRYTHKASSSTGIQHGASCRARLAPKCCTAGGRFWL